MGDKAPVIAGAFFFFQAEDGIRYLTVTGVQTCALPTSPLAETDAVTPTVTTEPYRSGRWSRRTVRGIRGARAAERRQRRFRFVRIEGLLELAALVLQARESNDGLSPQAVHLAVVVRNGAHVAGDRIAARLQCAEQWGQLGT